MVNETALKDAFSKIKDEFSSIKNEIQRLNNVVDEIAKTKGHVEEYRKKPSVEKTKTEKKFLSETSVEGPYTNIQEVSISNDEIIDADSYY